MQSKIEVGVLGATGMVGQHFVKFLQNHPWFDLTWVGASDRSAGKKYRDATSWRLEGAMPERVADLTVDECKPGNAPRLMFSATDASVATEIERAFARPIASLFTHFDPVPVAAGSIAQVHRATLASGEVVAVKVRRPGIDTLIESDLGVLAHLAHLAERYVADADLLSPSGLVAEFARSIRREQDLAREGRVIERFRRAFSGDPTICFPAVHWPSTCTRRCTASAGSPTRTASIATCCRSRAIRCSVPRQR